MFDKITDDLPCGDAMARLDYFFTEITDNEPNLRGLAIYYEGSYRETKYSRGGEKLAERTMAPVFGEAQNRIGWLQKYVNFRRFPKNRPAFVSGGYRTNFTVELWLVHRNSQNPKPKPDIVDIRFRNGAFTEFHCN
ncbi:MAG: hypothetical protein PSX80_17630 [bacterium]|nr:hypothetical protein [bacterium]